MSLPWYLALGGGISSLLALGVAGWFLYSSKLANSERDQAQAQAAAATDLASRLNASLQTLKIDQDKVKANDQILATDAATSADAAASFLNSSK